MKYYILILFCFLYGICAAQLNEDFSDGDFTANPAWNGSSSGADFEVSDQRLRSNSSIAGSSFYLSTENSLAMNAIWEFWVNLQFSTSGTNYTDIYLISDQADLQNTLIQGYFVRIGNTDDEISLYKRSGTAASSIKIIDGLNGSVKSSNNTVKVRVSRNEEGLFMLERQIVNTDPAFYTEGSVIDLSYTSSTHFGIYIRQSTATFHKKHFFDDLIIKAIETDSIPPRLISAFPIDSNTVEILFDEPIDSADVVNNNFSLDNIWNQADSIIFSPDPARLFVKFAQSFTTGSHLITVRNVRDRQGNIISDNNYAVFNYIRPYYAKQGDLIINEIFPDPSPTIGLPAKEFVELFNNSHEHISLKDWKLADQSGSARIGEASMAPGAFLILCAKADTSEFIPYGNVHGISSWPTLNNSGEMIRILNPDNLVIDSVDYSDTWYGSPAKKQGGWSLERTDPESACGGLFNWKASVDTTGGTPGRQNSVHVSGYDLLALKADSLKQISDSTLKIYFNKHLDGATLLTENFELNPFSEPVSVTADSEFREVTISYEQLLSADTEYSLSLSSLRDCGRKLPATDTLLSFRTPKLSPLPPPIPERTDTAHILITEIFADPSPEVGLPLVEFVEIFNPGKDTVDLDQWIIHDPGTKAIIRNRKILPEEYAILCPAADTLQYQPFGKTIPISPWPSLNNNADQIVLKSFKRRLVDSVDYSDAWYRSPAKKQGGWSLERTDPESACGGLFNWKASVDTTGGTPGRQNSVHVSGYDLLALKADSLKQTSDSTLKIYFNKHLDGSTVLAENFILSPSTDPPAKITADYELKEFTIIYNQPFEDDTGYTLLLSDLKDCSGKLIRADTRLSFRTPKLPPLPPPTPERIDTARIFITEIFADPSPEVGLPLVEFVEIFNPGKDTIDLDQWVIHDPGTKAVIRNRKILPEEYAILCPAADTLQYQPFGKTIPISPWPSLNNNADQIMLKSFKGRLVDSVDYSDAWYRSPAKKQGGWSLERTDPESACGGLFNWKASVDTAGGTPGKQNSTYVSGYDLLSLKADSLKQTSSSTLKIYFNKYLDSATLLPGNFELNPFSEPVSVTADSEFREVTISYEQLLSADTEYTLSLSSLKDCSGKLPATDTLLSFRTPKLPPPPPPIPERIDTARIFITEIFADPSPEVGLPLVEFIEVFNPGKDTVDLDQWVIYDPGTKAMIRNQKILPQEYAVLCPTTDTLQYQPFGKTIPISPWPSLNNNADQIMLKSFKGRLVDSVDYSDAWYRSQAKRQGGWSLERTDPESACSGLFNWKASVDAAGGTPGRQNSVYASGYDLLPLKADSLKQTSDSTLKIYFNKHLDGATLLTENFKLNPFSEPALITADTELMEIMISYGQLLLDNTEYSLSLSSLKDCSGKLPPIDTMLIFRTPKLPPPPPPIPERIDTARIFITEIFADPSPEVGLPLVEFVEIFNPGKDTVDLDQWIIHDPGTKAIIRNRRILPEEYAILCPAADTLQYLPFGKTIPVSPWPSLNNNADQVVLKSFKGRLVDSVNYSDTWYKEDGKKNGGYSLEMIDLHSICTGIGNWQASIDPAGGTPGRQNSVYGLPAANEPLKLINAVLSDSSSLLLSFNKNIESSSALNPENYTLNNNTGIPASVGYSNNPNDIVLKYVNPLPRGMRYKISVKNILDCKGQQIDPENSSKEFVLTRKIEKGNILISEILFNPRPGGPDFVEIYNYTDQPLDLKELSIAGMPNDNPKTLSKNQLLIMEGQYLVISANTNYIRNEYHSGSPENFLQLPSLPAFNDDKGTVALLSNGETIDRFDYTEKMHFPLLKDFEGVSLERSSFSHDANEAGNFGSATAASGYATPGLKNSRHSEAETPGSNEEFSLASMTFSPDNDGFEDLLRMHYRFTAAGMIANISIYNHKGILVKKICRNHTLDSAGVFTWDGLDEQNSMSATGIYIIYAEIFDLDGKLIRYRKPFVLARKF